MALDVPFAEFRLRPLQELTVPLLVRIWKRQPGIELRFNSPRTLKHSDIAMNSNRVSSWLTLGANIGVIVGIGFLVAELRQNSDIATAQARLEYAAGWRAVDGTRQDAAFAATLAASIESPDTLSLVQVIQLDAYYWGVIDQMLSAKTASDTGLRDTPFEDAAQEVGRLYFSNVFAQSWWKQVRSNWSSPAEREFLRIMDNAILAAKPGPTTSAYQLIHQNLSTPQIDSSE